MYTYRNRRTGAEFLSKCECSGKDWERIAPGPADKMKDIVSNMPVATSQQTQQKRPKTTRKKKTDE